METCRTTELEIAYEEDGSSKRPVAVLSHGWPDDVRCWDAVSASLQAEGWRILKPYTRGTGPTRFLSELTLRSGAISALTYDLHQFLQALDLHDVTLVGYDWGARAGYGVAALFPQRIKANVAAAAAYHTAWPPNGLRYDDAKAYWLEWFCSTQIGRREFRQDPHRISRFFWQDWTPKPFDPNSFDEIAPSLSNPDWPAISIHAYLHRSNEVKGAAEHEEVEEALSNAPATNVPTIVLHGSEDRCNLPHTTEEKEQYFTGYYERRVLPETGHFVPREAPDAVVRAVLDLGGEHGRR
jgi:pimeloyl-ACP methyl ester carboxylesterase